MPAELLEHVATVEQNNGISVSELNAQLTRKRSERRRAAATAVASSVKVATLTLDATWSRFRNVLAVSKRLGGFGMFWRFRNVLAVSECSGGFGMFRWFKNVSTADFTSHTTHSGPGPRAAQPRHPSAPHRNYTKAHTYMASRAGWRASTINSATTTRGSASSAI